MKTYYYYKCYYTDGTWDVLREDHIVWNPKQVCQTCYEVERISMFDYYWADFQFAIGYYLKKLRGKRK